MSGFDTPSWIDSVRGGAANPGNWLFTADGLKRASDLLRAVWLEELQSLPDRFAAFLQGDFEAPWQPEPWVGAPAMTLAALAVENLLKGLIVAVEPELLQPDTARPERLFGSPLRTHNLVALARRARVAVTDDEDALLRRLTEFVVWAGRYPFPLNALDAAPREGAESGGAFFSSEWFRTLDSLFERLRDELADAGVRVARAQEAAVAEERKRRRPELLARLELLNRIELEPSVVVFETDLPEGTSASVSCNCGVTFRLNDRRPAGICRCGTLYFGERRGVAGKVQFTVEAFPA